MLHFDDTVVICLRLLAISYCCYSNYRTTFLRSYYRRLLAAIMHDCYILISFQVSNILFQGQVSLGETEIYLCCGEVFLR